MFAVVVSGMGESRGKPPPMPAPRATAGVGRSEDDALFDIWLERRLRDAFEGALREPIPPELVALIENHRRKR